MNKLTHFAKSYWIAILIAVVAAVVYLKRKKSVPQDLDANANQVLNQTGITTEVAQTNYKQTALQIAHNLGTAYPWYDPRSFTENDKEVFDLVKPLAKNDFKVVSKLYFEVYAVGKNLSSDLARLLDKRYYSQLTVK